MNQWQWRKVNDFDRIEKFSDDEVFEDEVVFKLTKKQGVDEEIVDEKPQHILEGYDCFSLYKHSDDSYEWRLCKIVGKVLKPEYKQMAMKAFQDLAKKSGVSSSRGDNPNASNVRETGSDQVHDKNSKITASKIASLKKKSRFSPTVNVFLSEREKVFIFKFE